jgi:hypothetical protein
MRHRQLITSWLLVVAALLSLIGVVFTRHSVTSSELIAREQNLLRVFDEDAVTRIAVEGTEQPFSLVRQGAVDSKDFRIVAPIEEQAKAEKVSSLLGSLRFASFLRRLDDGQNSATELGLEPPRWILHVDHGDIRYRIRLGGKATSPPGSSYLEVTGENAPAKGVFVVRDGLVSELTLNLGDFRSNELAAIGQSSLQQVDWQYAAQRWTLENDGGRWRFAAEQGKALAGREQVERFFTQLTRLKLETFLDMAAARNALGQDVMHLSLLPKHEGAVRIEIEIGGPCPEHPQWLVAVRSEKTSVAGCVVKEIAEELKITPAMLAEQHLFSLRHDEVESFEISRGEAKLAATRSEKGFRMTAPTSADVDGDLGEQWLKEWLELTGETPASGSVAAGTLVLSEPRASVLLRAVSDVPQAYGEQRVDLGTLAGKPGVFAVRSADGAVLHLPQLDLNQLDVTGLKLRSRTVLDLQVRQLTRIEVVAPNVRQVIVQESAGPVLVEPPGSTPDGILLVELLDTLRALRAVRWVAARDGGEFGLADPWARVSFTVQASTDKREDHVLRLGASTKGGFFAQLDQEPVFVVSRSSAEALSTWVLDRGAFSPPLDTVARIELRAGHNQLVLERVGEHFAQIGSQLPLSGAEQEILLAELETLRPEAAIHLGAALPNEGLGRPLLRLVAQQKSGVPRVAWTIGAADVFRNLPIYFARVDGIDATYVIARGPVQRILDLL